MVYAVVMYNISPVVEHRGSHVPFHSVVDQPFKDPFTFAYRTDEGAMCGAFVGACGEFLVMSSDTFIIATPRNDDSIALGDLLFPKRSTHHLLDAKIGASYHIGVGSSILMYDAKATPSLRSATLFFGDGVPNQDGDAYHNGLPYFGDAMRYFSELSNRFIVHKASFREPKRAKLAVCLAGEHADRGPVAPQLQADGDVVLHAADLAG
jgi:hypothetical protein